nr:3-keto-steroid reductase [Quercus suber]
MEVLPSDMDRSKTKFTVLITGANSGLGFATCCRLIDEFLLTRPQSQTLHLLFSTRDTRKGDDALLRLNRHLQKTLREADGTTAGVSRLLEARVKLENVLVDLTKLLSVKALAKQLLMRQEKLDVVVWNAGIAGYSGMSWFRAIWLIVTDLVHATTYPTFMACDVGSIARAQLPSSAQAVAKDVEPKLGQIFLSNVFGHYMLTHWLAPLFEDSTRIIWISSVSAIPSTFRIDDFQGLTSDVAYEGSKRLTDLLVLNSESPATKPYVESFLPLAKPAMYIAHPGVVYSNISGLHPILGFFIMSVFYIARILGSPWHLVDSYKGAVSVVHTVLAPEDRLEDVEAREGKGKWGSVTSVFGDERVGRTEVEGWGFCGRPGVAPSGSVVGTTGRHRDRKETTREMREQFEDDGRIVWREMELLRTEWQDRLGGVDLDLSRQSDL